MKFSALKNSEMTPFLSSLSQVRPKGSKKVVTIVSTLMLTSLVDVFSILVIYLLVNTSASKESIKMDRPIKLPFSSQSSLMASGANLQIIGEKYFINSKPIAFDRIFEELKRLNGEFKKNNDNRFRKIIIQADKTSPFERINPILLISAEAGFENIKFATIKRGT